jgi:hypothetical protein
MCLVNKYVSSVQRQRASVCEKERKQRAWCASNLAIAGILLGLSSCARAGAGTQEAAAEPFRRIQKEEQQVALGQAALDQARDCETAQSTSEAQICKASERLCGVASSLKDRDASARCQNAQDSCTGAREHVASLCATNAPAP